MHKLAELCVRRPVLATMLIVSLTVMGIYSYIGLGVDYFPNIDIPTIAVTVNNPGASAEQIETEITKKVEGAINTISGISELRSTSSEGQSMVIVTFVLEKNGDVAAQEVRDKVNLLAGQLPETAKAPIILKADPGATPVMQITVAGNRPLRDVTRFAEKAVKERLESISGVGQVTLVGDTKRAIQVRLDPNKMRAYGVTVPDVTNALRSQNLMLPGGRVQQGAIEVTLRTMGKVARPEEFDGIAIANRGDYVVRLRDIGSVEDGQAEMRTAAFFNGKPAVLLTVTKQSGQNTVTVAADLKHRIKAIQDALPPDMTVKIVDDQAMFTEAALAAVKEHLVLGSILASAVIFFFLANVRTTLIAAIAIPTSIVSTFFLMAVMGYTLNVVTMLALTLMVGVVIDDAIIVLENIYRYIEEKGMSPFEAAIKGTKEIGFAVLATTLSLMAVFVPVAFMGGIVGRVLASFGLTAAFAVGVSLLVSYTLTPMLTSRFVKPPRREDIEAHHGSKDSIIFKPIETGYMAILRWAMAHRGVVVLMCVLVIASIVPLFAAIGKNFAPDEDRSKLTINIRAPEGTGLAATTTIIERIAADLRKMPEVQDTLVSVGSAITGMGPGMVLGGSSGNVGSITVALTPIETRTRTQFDMMPVFRQMLMGYPNLRTSVLALGGPGGGAGVQYSLRGPELAKLGQYADQLYKKISTNPKAVDVDTSLVYGKPELRVEINRQRAADLGVRVQDIATALNVLVGGQNVTTFDVGEDQYDVTLRAAEGFRTTAEGVQRMTVPSSKRGVVDISEVVDLIPSTGPSAIERLNRERQVTLTANLAPGASQSEVIADVQAAVASMQMDAGYVAKPIGISEELAKTGRGFALAISLSFIFMYIVLAAQFESFIHPVTILLTLPLAVPFGILSLFIGGQTVNLFAGLGLLLLFGIVKKNAILQIDHSNGLRAEGLPRDEAILQANKERLRPILMTTIALVAGMIPLIVANGAGSSTNKTIGVLVVGGQMLCLLLTLLAVPVFYSLFDDFENWPALSRLAARLRRTTPAARAGAAVLVLALGLTTQTHAQTPAAAPSAPLPLRVGVIGQRDLSLPDALREALANNPDIAVARTGVEQAGYGVSGALGAFEPQFGLQSSLVHQVTPVASSLSGSATGALTSNDLVVGPRVSGLLPSFGTSYQAAFTTHRQTTDNSFVQLNPQYPSALALSVTQPLLRGRKVDAARRQVEVAKRNQELTEAQFKQRVMDVALQVEQAYWDLVFARENLAVQTAGLELANRLVEANRRLVGQGVSAPIDIIEAETQRAALRQNIFAAQTQLTRVENTLKTLLAPDTAAGIWSAALTPTTANVTPAGEASLDAALKSALGTRPELQQLSISSQTNRTNTDYFRDQTRPQVDLVGSYTSNGLAGQTFVSPTGNPLTSSFGPLFERINALSTLQGLAPIALGGGGQSSLPERLVGGLGQSYTNLLKQSFPTVEVGVRIGVPFRNQTAEANLATSVAEGKRLDFQRRQLENAVAADVRNAMQAVASARAILESATEAVSLAEQQHASEQRKFEAGTSTVFLVLQRQSALINARSLKARAESELSKSLAQLNRATGRTLDAHQITISAR